MDNPSYLWKQQPFQGEHKDTTQKHSPENAEVAITFCRLVTTLSTLEEYQHLSLPEEHSAIPLVMASLYQLEEFVCRLCLHVHQTQSWFTWRNLVIQRKCSISEIGNVFKILQILKQNSKLAPPKCQFKLLLFSLNPFKMGKDIPAHPMLRSFCQISQSPNSAPIESGHRM